MQTTVAEELAEAVADESGGASIGDVVAEARSRQYGDYIACEVSDVSLADDEVAVAVDIPGRVDDETWTWSLFSVGPTKLDRALADHGLAADEVERLEGKRVLVRPDEGASDGTWKIYDPADPSKAVGNWFDEQPFTPYGEATGKAVSGGISTEHASRIAAVTVGAVVGLGLHGAYGPRRPC